MTKDEMLRHLQKTLPPKRVAHSLAVAEAAKALAARFGEDAGKAEIAGLLHDCAKYMNDREIIKAAKGYGLTIDEWERQQPPLLHARVGARVAQAVYGVRDEVILRAIERHTFGAPGMSRFDLLLNLADYIAEGRLFPGVDEIRALALADPEAALLVALRGSMVRILTDKGIPLHPATVATYNDLLLQTATPDPA